MTKYDIKNQLNNYRDLKAESQQLASEIERLEAAMYSPSGPNLDGMPRGSAAGNPILNHTAQKLALLDRYRAMQEKLAAEQAAIEDMIDGLSSRERRLLRYRYFDGMTWEKVCVAINYSWRRTHAIHSKALEKLAEKYKED